MSNAQALGEMPSEDSVCNYVLSLLSKPSNKPEIHKSEEDSNQLPDSISISNQSAKKPIQQRTSNDLGTNMVIHVCDEAKKLNQDFSCPRDLLVSEMKYFAEYLSVDAQRLEEVDISVHCDIHIFDWLMRYVKRDTNLIKPEQVPQLEAANVVSILISSDFLRMESLVEECVVFCHENMSAVLATPCNMNCINDKLCWRIAQRFTNIELEAVRDRKDKFKSKLYCKKIEQLFSDIPTIFKCGSCQRVMTGEQSSRLMCNDQNLTVDKMGKLSFKHVPDPAWDVNSWMVSLHEELNQWSLVYWRLYATVNDLSCSTCMTTFQLFEYSHCKYHPEKPKFQTFRNNAMQENAIGVYPCCGQNVLRFDPTHISVKGCSLKAHTVLPKTRQEQDLLNVLLKHLSLIQADYNNTFNDSGSSLMINIFSREELGCHVDETASIAPSRGAASMLFLAPALGAKKTSAIENRIQIDSDSDCGSDEDSDDDDDDLPVLSKQPHRQMRYQPKPAQDARHPVGNARRGAPAKSKQEVRSDVTVYSKYPSRQKWDSNRTMRFNQDMQREEDRRRMNLLSAHLSGKQGGSTAPSTAGNNASGKSNQPVVKELQGGMFIRLELAFLNSLKSYNVDGAGGRRTSQNAPNSKDARLKFRGR